MTTALDKEWIMSMPGTQDVDGANGDPRTCQTNSVAIVVVLDVVAVVIAVVLDVVVAFAVVLDVVAVLITASDVTRVT